MYRRDLIGPEFTIVPTSNAIFVFLERTSGVLQT